MKPHPLHTALRWDAPGRQAPYRDLFWLTWVQWSIKWDPSPGSYGIRVRAEDKAGNNQPDSVPLFRSGVCR